MDSKLIDPSKFPELAKVRVAKLPMTTIRGFMEWLKERYPGPGVDLHDVDVEIELYAYYNINTAKLAEELAARNPSSTG